MAGKGVVIAGLLVIAFLAFASAYAVYYETGQKPAEKTSRAQLIIRLPSTFSPATYTMSYSLTPGPGAAQAATTDLFYSQDSSYFTAGNSMLSVTVDKSSGAYSVSAGTRNLFTAQSHLIESGTDHSSGPARPLVMASGPQKLSINWSMMDTTVRIDHVLTIYSNRPELLVQHRAVALSDIASVTDLELDRLTSFDSSYFTNVYSVRLQANGKDAAEYDGAWGAVFPRYEPSVSVYNPTTNDAVGMVFDNPDSIKTTLGNEIKPEEAVGFMPQHSVITRNTYFTYSNSKFSARELWLKKIGPSLYNFPTTWNLAPSGTPIEQVDSSFTFDFVKPPKYATLAALAFNVTYADYSDIANKLACYLNDNSLFDRQVYNGTPITAEFPYRWLNQGTNTVRCRAAGTNTVAIPRLNLTIANAHGAQKFWGSNDTWMMPITLTGLSSTSKSASVKLDYLRLGLRPPIHSSSFRLLNEGGFQIPLSADSQYVYFSVDVPACCGSPRTVYLAFSSAKSEAFFSDAGSPSLLPVVNMNDFVPDYGILIDGGMARPLNPRLLYATPPSREDYLLRELPPGVVTETAKKFVFDPATARAAVIKLIVWRKA